MKSWEVVIGIETHVQLLTRSKIFSGSSTAFGAAPNTQASAIDIALPGVLPVLNRQAVECAIRFGLAVEGEIAPKSVFARKNYCYPDLPKGYQISQYELPVVSGGKVNIRLGEGENAAEKTIHLTRAHLEEDAGKSLHEDFQGRSGIDLNRAGTALLEIVTEPDMRSSAEAVAYARALHTLVRWIGICDGNMQEGSFRCDANVSVRPLGQKEFGTRREIKNLNSFRFLQQAIDYEVQWQIGEIEEGRAIRQATVLFDPDTGETRAMRSKEDAHDYRYFPDPDLLPLVIGHDWVERARAEMPELPVAKQQRFMREYLLSAYDAAALTASLEIADYYEAAVRAAGHAPATSAMTATASAAKICANWVMGEVSRRLNAADRPIEQAGVSAQQLGELALQIYKGVISNNAAKQVFDELWNNLGVIEFGIGEVLDLIEAKGLKQMNDTGALEKIIDDVIAANPSNVAQFKSGKDKALNALIGQAMKASKGRANPQQVNELLRRKLTLD